MTWLAIVGAVGSMISLGYYLRVVAVTWAPGPRAARARCWRVPGPVGHRHRRVRGVGVVVLALMASPLLDACRGAAESLLAP